MVWRRLLYAVLIALAFAKMFHLLRKEPSLGHEHASKHDVLVFLRIIGARVQRLGASTIFSRFYPSPREPRPFNGATGRDAPNGLAGWADFREFRFKGVANELSAGTKRNVIGRSV
jgi:hypothetical protein